MKGENKDDSILSALISKRNTNIQEASTWPKWEIEEELQRATSAKKVFLKKNPMHDLTIIEERIDQLEESLKLCDSEL
jgi:hypothetical protein